jgi:hypothetical protein
MSTFPNPQQVLQPQQNVFVPSYPLPFQPFNTQGNQPVQFNVPQSSQSPAKRIINRTEGFSNVKDTHQAFQAQQGSKLNESLINSGSRKTNIRDSSISPAKPKKPTNSLPTNWKTATDPQGNIYYYHTITR